MPEHDVDYLYGQVSIDKPFVDWGQLRQPVHRRWRICHSRRPGGCRRASPGQRRGVVRIWQANIRKTIIAHVPVSNGQVQETGDFELDG